MTLVFVGHFEGLFRKNLPANGISIRLIDFLAVIAHQGVCFFLVLSGYFVYRAYLENSGCLATFILRRVRRIYPPYLAMFGLYVALSMLFPSESKIPAHPGAALLYLTGNLLLVSSRPIIIVSWTIGTLLALYTVVPVFWAAVRYERWNPACRISLIVLLAAGWFALPRSIPMLESRVVFVFVGFALCEAVRAGTAFRSGGELAGLAILGCGYVLWFATDHHWLGFLPIHIDAALSKFIFLSPGLFYACGYVMIGSRRLASWLERAHLPRLGRISYSYYLCHGLILKGLAISAPTVWPESTKGVLLFWAGLPIAYGCTLLAGWLWFHMVEMRLASLGSGRLGQWRSPVLPIPASHPKLSVADESTPCVSV